MLSSVVVAVSLLSLLALQSSAHGFDWVKSSLDDCWRRCLKNSGSGCKSEDCICDASQDDNYLTDAVLCMRSDCQADDWSLDVFFLGPLDMWCSAAGNSIPEDIMSSAYDCATATASVAPLTTREVQHSSESGGQKTKGGDSITATVTSTITRTTTDGDGHTIQLVIPIVMGPGILSQGPTSTSTLDEDASSTDSPSSSGASASSTPGVTASASTQAQQSQVASSTTSSKAAQKTSNNNGSPFENMQAGAERFVFSGTLVGLGAVAGLFAQL
ncbi:hypothetical protein BDV96DRAFT_652815 [Lophiotrema nucula]|uniref:Extracellular membrane protein CFEM domain-containing protein n=1 Tax=Lophiotrema nucula TaxID=690887 RepID=A0A6A5YNN4_9PLEO|nr:hypothetical protein BDV96DRAFT_652815 [Lophiotrema nucula]